jgi:hypothetical protein
MGGLGRKLRQTFGISAPRMAVRTHLSWRWKIPAMLGLFLLVVGMWWWGFDFGQFLSGFNRGEVAEKQGKLESEVALFKDENVKLRGRAAQLESDLNITRGAQATLSKQSLELQAENTQIKEELAFLQKLFSDTGKQGTISIQRLSAERERDDAYHYSLLVVRGGNPSGEFAGQLTLQAGLLSGGRLATVALPDDQPDASATLKLKFKYYQRIEGTIRVPPGSQLKTLQARVLELGQTSPRATRSLNIS